MKYYISFKDHLLREVKKLRKKILTATATISNQEYILNPGFTVSDYIQFLKSIDITEYDVNNCYGKIVFTNESQLVLNTDEGKQGTWVYVPLESVQQLLDSGQSKIETARQRLKRIFNS
jgi:AAA+ ATPase superfamily predicted ATPase